MTRSALLCYFYPRSRGFGCLGGGISIHALLAESDNRVRLSPLGPKYFYPRSPCGERHELSERRWRPSGISIHALLAESDGHGPACRPAERNFYPRSPCGERPKALPKPPRQPQFLSTLSLRRATYNSDNIPPYRTISIHALLAESDRPPGNSCGTIYLHFYPRSPCGERRKLTSASGLAVVFLSTLSLRRATAVIAVCEAWAKDFYPRSPCGERLTVCQDVRQGFIISIHALLAESDTASSILMVAPNNFYPRSPCGERPQLLHGPPDQRPISIHALLAESDAQRLRVPARQQISIHALLAESDG